MELRPEDLQNEEVSWLNREWQKWKSVNYIYSAVLPGDEIVGSRGGRRRSGLYSTTIRQAKGGDTLRAGAE